MKTFLIAALLLAPVSLAMLTPTAAAECFQGSDNPNGNTVEIISLGAVDRPNAGLWIEDGCYPFTTYDTTEDQATAGAGVDATGSPQECEFIPEVRIAGVPVPGTNQTYCTFTHEIDENREVSTPVIRDLGILICTSDAQSCVWISARYLVYRCKLAESDPLVITIPELNIVITVSCRAT